MKLIDDLDNLSKEWQVRLKKSGNSKLYNIALSECIFELEKVIYNNIKKH